MYHVCVCMQLVALIDSDTHLLLACFGRIVTLHLVKGMMCVSQGEGQHGSTLCKDSFASAFIALRTCNLLALSNIPRSAPKVCLLCTILYNVDLL